MRWPSRSRRAVCLLAATWLAACSTTPGQLANPPKICVPAAQRGKAARDSAFLWRGAVVWPGADPSLSYFVDGQPLVIDYFGIDVPIVNTLGLANGTHQLQLANTPTGSRQGAGAVNVQNPAAPAFPGKFVDLGAPGELPQPQMSSSPAEVSLEGAIAADFDGDGRLDLFAWSGSSAGQVYLQDAPMHFHAVGTPYPTVLAAGAGDLDNDGRTDLVAVGATIHVLHNTGNPAALFEDLTVASGIPPEAAPQMPPGLQYQGVTLADIDDDGLLDVAVAQMNCVAGGANAVFRNEGDFHFARVDDQLGLTFSDAATFDLLMDRLTPGGPLIVWPFFEGCRPQVIERLHEYPPGPDMPGKPKTTAAESMRGSMGSVYIDMDGDGVLDLWSSATSVNPVLMGPDYVDDVSASMGLQTFPDEHGHLTEQWDMALLDADMDGRPDVFVAESTEGAVTNSPVHPHNRFAWQADTCAWRESAEDVGIHDLQRSCEVAQPADLDGDGDADLLVGCYGQLQVLRNDIAPAGLGRTVILHGTLSNPDGVGAVLFSPEGEQRLVRGGGQPFAGGVIHESIRAPSGTLKVRWPSGLEQQVEVGTAPVLEITEPEVFRLGARRVATGSSNAVPIEVHPEALNQPDAMVQVALSAGDWAEPLTKGDDGVWRGMVAPPGNAAVVKLTISIGAQTFAVQPRIFVR